MSESIKQTIETELLKCHSELDYAKAIFLLGETYMEQLGSDELPWEVARAIWEEKHTDQAFEARVYQEFEKLMMDL